MVTLLVDRVVMGILPISAWPMQVVCPSRPLEVTVVCAKADRPVPLSPARQRWLLKFYWGSGGILNFIWVLRVGLWNFSWFGIWSILLNVKTS
ncbi:MAG: hypothetical protein OXC63_05940 [Aestuariivita sp.]|nr:hypothetical protein [Aestuariivita sp.]MCY4346318.1 hypothetical protein [Aestuariivita sp.]